MDNKWFFYNGDIILQSEDQEQLEMANAWILALKEAIREQVMEEINGGNELSNGYEQPELPEVTC